MMMDFERAQLLLTLAEKLHGYPKYRKIKEEAERELEVMAGIREPDEAFPKVVTPPAGPASSAIQYPDGTLEQVQEPVPSSESGVAQPVRPSELAPGYDPSQDLRQSSLPMEDQGGSDIRRI